ncbi:MAG: hypothetical protein LC122_04790 [Chitinophagales bacterium]|nr:hypothetical protein [Chitinophagales bacterium]
MALILSKHIELKIGSSIKHFITECKKVTDTRMLNTITQKELIVKGKMTNTVTQFLSKLNLQH